MADAHHSGDVGGATTRYLQYQLKVTSSGARLGTPTIRSLYVTLNVP